MTLKTYKRELATAMLGVLYAFGVAAAVGSQQALEVVRILAVPTFLAVSGAFGLDAVAKQIRGQP